MNSIIYLYLGGDIENQFKIHAIRIEPDGINYFKPRLIFSCDAICIADLDPTIFTKWICMKNYSLF